MKHWRRGFTLGEMITTVAVVGTLAAIAIPGYIKMRQGANMEMVRQQMRIIGEKMVEILSKNGQFPDASLWPLDGSTDPDEMAISASLSAIDDYCYTTNDYVTDAGRGAYRFCSRPQVNACGARAGTKKFCVHFESAMSQAFAPGIVGEIELRAGEVGGVSLYTSDASWLMTGDNINAFDAYLSYGASGESSLEYYNEMFETEIQMYADREGAALASGSSYLMDMVDGYTVDGIFSTHFIFSDTEMNNQGFQMLQEGAFANLEAKGYEVYLREVTVAEVLEEHMRFWQSMEHPERSPYQDDGLWQYYNAVSAASDGTHKAYQISVRASDPPATEEEYTQRMTELQARTSLSEYYYNYLQGP